MSSNNSSSPPTTPVEPPQIWDFYLCGFVSLTVGIFGIFVNIITVFVIKRNKALRAPCFLLIAGHAFYAWVMAFGFVISGVHYLGLGFNFLNAIYPRLTCGFVYITLTISFHPSSVITFLIGFERMGAIAFPTAYKKNKKRFIVIGMIIAAIVGVNTTIVGTLTAPHPLQELIKCYTMFSGYHATFSVFFTYFNFAFHIAAVLSYVIMYAVIFYRKRKQISSKSKNEPAGQQKSVLELDKFLQRQLKLLPLINTLTVAYFFFGIGPPLIASISSTVAGGRFLQRAGLYVVALKAPLPCIDFCVLTAKCTEFREGLKSMMGIQKSNQVVPMTSTVRHDDF